MAKWLGYVVVARAQGSKKAYKEVSKPYATRGGAEDFLKLYQQAHPAEDVYLSEKIQREAR